MQTAWSADEEDVFGSDFESTDEEAVQEDVDVAAEKVVREEERSSRKVRDYPASLRICAYRRPLQTARSTLDKVTAAAHARQKATFNPQSQAPSSSTSAPPDKMRRRVSLGVAVNAETGEILERRKRHSQRRHTMLNTSLTVERMKDAEERKV